MIDAYRRRQGKPARQSNQHDHADLLLRDQRRAAARRGDSEDQGIDRKTYGKRGEPVVRQNYAAVDAALEHLHEVDDARAASPALLTLANRCLEARLNLCRKSPREIIAGQRRHSAGERFPGRRHISGRHRAMGEAKHRAGSSGLGDRPCIQCGKCVLVCPHCDDSRQGVDERDLPDAPEGFKTMPAKWRELPDQLYTIQVAVEDCTGCRLCVEVCPAKDKSNVSRKALNMHPQLPLRDSERVNWDYFLTLPEFNERRACAFDSVKNVQLLQPLFEFSGACSGCGETPYIKLMTQLFGDRAIIANAPAARASTAATCRLRLTRSIAKAAGRPGAIRCLRTTPSLGWACAWRSIIRMPTQDDLVERLRDVIGDALAERSACAPINQPTQASTCNESWLPRLKASSPATRQSKPEARDLLSVADALVKKSVWIVGGDGWAYDIGYGGLDHVLASGQNVNILVLDTEVYSNTGGQASKATPMGAVAKFAAGGKPPAKKIWA